MKFSILYLTFALTGLAAIAADINYDLKDTPPGINRCEREATRTMCQNTCGCFWDHRSEMCRDGNPEECDSLESSLHSNRCSGSPLGSHYLTLSSH